MMQAASLAGKIGPRETPDTRRLSDITYDRVLEGLFDRKVPAGAFISQNDLVNLLDIPVQPLRDAAAAETAVSHHFQAALQRILGMF